MTAVHYWLRFPYLLPLLLLLLLLLVMMMPPLLLVMMMLPPLVLCRLWSWLRKFPILPLLPGPSKSDQILPRYLIISGVLLHIIL